VRGESNLNLTNPICRKITQITGKHGKKENARQKIYHGRLLAILCKQLAKIIWLD
jgi:hypothetical protein